MNKFFDSVIYLTLLKDFLSMIYKIWNITAEKQIEMIESLHNTMQAFLS